MNNAKGHVTNDPIGRKWQRRQLITTEAGQWWPGAGGGLGSGVHEGVTFWGEDNMLEGGSTWLQTLTNIPKTLNLHFKMVNCMM